MFEQRVASALPQDVRDPSSLVRMLSQPNDADLDEFRRGIEPLASAGKLGAVLAQFPRGFQGRAPRRGTISPACFALCLAIAWPSSCCPQQLERQHRRHARPPEHIRRRMGADRRAEIPLVDPSELSAERGELLLHAPARPERGEVVGATRSRKSATTISTPRRADKFPRPRVRQTIVKKLYLYTNIISREVGRQRRDDQATARRADRGEYRPEFIRALSRARAHSFTDIFLITSPRSSRAGTSSPAITRPKTV